MRQALGATHLQLLRRLAAESMLLTAAGEAIGLLFAWWSAPLFRRIPMPVPAPITLAFNWRMVAISLAISVVASLCFTAVAAWKGLRAEVQRVLLTSSRGLTTRTFAQRALVVTQLAVGCIIATAAMLLGRSLWNVQHVNVGFETANRVGARVSLSDQNYSTSQAAIFYRRLEEALQRTPGVEDVAFEQSAVLEVLRAVGRFRPDSAEPLSARYDAVSPGYFRTLAIPAVSGRAFDDHDTAASEPVIVINQTMARLLGEHPLGEMLTEDGRAWGLRSGTRLRIIGIVKDAQYNAITEPPQPYAYLPIAQSPHPDLEVYIHARMPQGEALALLRSEVHRLDPRVSLSDAGTLTDRVSTAETLPRSSAIAATALAGIAVFLALVGVYGVMTTSIENQRRELAIRSALGASTFSLVRRVVGEGTLLTVGALAAGIVGSLVGARALGGLLFGVQPYDLWSLVGGACFVLAARGRRGEPDPAGLQRDRSRLRTSAASTIRPASTSACDCARAACKAERSASSSQSPGSRGRSSSSVPSGRSIGSSTTRRPSCTRALIVMGPA